MVTAGGRERRFLTAVLALSLGAAPVGGVLLPVRSYTTADGLADDNVVHITQDHRGFLWLATPQGISRFDGYRFSTLGAEQGLLNPFVTAILEDPDGMVWLGTRGAGVVRLDADGKPVRVYPTGSTAQQARVTTLVRDRRGRLWAGTYSGAFVLDSRDGAFALVGRPSVSFPVLRMSSFSEDARGTMWWGTWDGLMRSRDDAVDETVGARLGIPRPVWATLVEGDRLWLGGTHGLWCVRLPLMDTTSAATPVPCEVRLEEGRPIRLPAAPGEVCHYGLPQARDYDVLALLYDGNEALWVATGGHGLLLLDAGVFRRMTTANRLIDDTITTLYEDRDENLWAATPRGVMMIEHDGLDTFDARDGLIDAHVVSLVADQDGRVCALGTQGHLQCLQGDRLEAVVPNVPPPLSLVGINQLLLQDHRGEWWVRAPTGLYRFAAGSPGTALRRKPQRWSQTNGLPADRPSRVFEDSRGDLWIGVWDTAQHTLVRRDADTGRLEPIALPAEIGPGRVPSAFGEDSSGALWIGFIDGGLVRLRDGDFDIVDPPRRQSIVAGVRAIHRDGKGRLWVAAEQDGLLRIDDPAAAQPSFVRYGKAQGLSSADVRCVTEDRWGRLYVGTQGGIDRLEPDTGAVRHYGSADGLARGGVEVCLAVGDRLWFGTVDGLSSLWPRPETPAEAPDMLISGVRIAGEPQPLSPFGAPRLEGFDLAAPGYLEIDFTPVGFSSGSALRYQYRLEGDGAAWSPPTAERSVNFASLPGGDYRFLVRAVAGDGRTSASPAQLGFRVVPPLWRQAWFLALLAALAVLAVAALIRYRVVTLLEVERVRTRIAADLHDDLGASLSWIARLSDLAAERVEKEPGAARQMLTQIASDSRQLIDATSDIVWAINPRRDDLASVFVRLRRIAGDLLGDTGTRLQFSSPPEAGAIGLAAERRRELYLLLKEAIHNTAKHARARQLKVRCEVSGGHLAVEVADDGVGFEPGDSTGDGQGLRSMKRRAVALGGHLTIDSAPGRGTRLRLEVPL